MQNNYRDTILISVRNWTASYTSPTPELYIKQSGPLSYGSFQNSFNNIMGKVLDEFCSKDDAYTAVEFGAICTATRSLPIYMASTGRGVVEFGLPIFGALDSQEARKGLR